MDTIKGEDEGVSDATAMDLESRVTKWNIEPDAEGMLTLILGNNLPRNYYYT